jgi:hypothetical protein
MLKVEEVPLCTMPKKTKGPDGVPGLSAIYKNLFLIIQYDRHDEHEDILTFTLF